MQDIQVCHEIQTTERRCLVRQAVSGRQFLKKDTLEHFLTDVESGKRKAESYP